MRPLINRFILLLLCCLAAVQVAAQKVERGYSNYNIYNGLPSNHVYQTIVDTFGYVWIATTKGVLKYNGYSFRRFGADDGIAKDDIWYLIEDEGNKVWLGSITNSFGYIQNNKFTSVMNNSDVTIKPQGLQKINNGIAFFPDSIAHLLEKRVDVACRVLHGKLEKFVINSNNVERRNLVFDAAGAVFELKNSIISQRVTIDGKVVNKKICNTSEPTGFIDTIQRVLYNCDRYFIVYANPTNIFYFIDINTGAVTKFSEKLNPLESWLTAHRGKDGFYLTTNKRVFVFDLHLKLRRVYYLKDLIPLSDTTEASFVWQLKDKFWKGFSTTSNLGMYQYFEGYPIRKVNIDRVKGVEYVGKTLSGTSYWWNNTARELISINTKGQVRRRLYADIYQVKEVLGFPGIGDFMYSKFSMNRLNDATGEMTDYLAGTKWYFHPEYVKKPVPIDGKYHHLSTLHIDNLYMYKDTLFVSSAGGNLFYKNYIEKDTFKATVGNRTISRISSIDTASKIMYVSLVDWFVTDHIFSGKRDSIRSSALKQLGVDGIVGIVADARSANLFILAKTGLFVFNTRLLTFKKLPLLLNVTMSSMQFENGNLVLNSPYGLAFYKVSSNGSVSEPYYVINYKYKYYKYLYGSRFYIGDSTVLFNTDNGLMSVPIPDDSLYKHNNSKPTFKLTVTYKEQLRQLSKGDTLFMDQQNPVYMFDVINPTGVGSPRFYYYVPGDTDTWQQLNGFEWFALGLKPERYNKVYIKVMDEGWASEPIVFYVYVNPYWWQTLSGKVIIGFVLLLLIGGVALGVMRITRNRINRVNARKNLEAELKSLRTSMELKSIHAQINPHFIFNTLSTGLYFIKKNRMEDAYDHISAFSELLRNYIKSSRDKYILLNEEIDNLKRYVSLQQSRFENLHEFDVEIGEGVNVYAEKIPALLLQPLVENAINHGLFHKATPGRLLLRFEKNNNGDLICIIDDDGVGREKSKAINAETRHKTQSYGTDLVRELIEAFNKYEPVNINIEYIDKQPPLSGTIVVLTIKEVKDDK